MEQALSDVKVVDLTYGMGGPYCTKLLADFGASVIKIEKPGEGDPARRRLPFLKDEPHPEKSGPFLYLNTNKKSITLDIESELGKKIFKELVKRADVVVENFKPGTMSKLGLSYEALKGVNPTLIMSSITNFGQTSRYKDYKSVDLTMGAVGGAMFVTGHHMGYVKGKTDTPKPLKLGGNITEYQTGLVAFASILIALYWRAVSGVGQYIDLSARESVASCLEGTNSEYAYLGVVRRRGMSRIVYGHPFGVYPCKDGYVIVVPGLGGMDSLALLLEKPELQEHPMFKDRYARQAHPEEFDELIIPWLMEHTKEEIQERAQELRMPFSTVSSIDDLPRDPQLKARGFFVDVDHPVAGKLTYPGAPFKMSETPWQPGRAPLLGEHNEEIYQELGYSKEDIVKLRELKVI